MSTVALTMIVKDEYKAVFDIVEQCFGTFDQFVFVFSNEEAKNYFDTYDWRGLDEGVIFTYYRPWNNRFDEARNFALSKVTTDYWFWMDADDKFDFSYIPQLVELADQGNYDEIMLPYNYARDEEGNCVAWHWRERLLRTSHPFTWKGWVHETPISDLPYSAHRADVEVFHNADDNHTQESLERNHAILLDAVAASDDPRYKLYLGQSFFSLGKYGEAVEILDKFTKVSGSGEDIYRAFCCMSECAFKMKHSNAALQYALQASAQIPAYPFAYRLLAQWEDALGNYKEALEWAKTSYNKPAPDGMGVFDPSSRNDVILIAVHCEYMLGNFNKALSWLRRLPADSKHREEMEPAIIQEADDETFVGLLPKLRSYFKSDESLYDSLVYDMKYDVRLRGLRDLVEPAKDWADNTIVFLVGEGYEEWGPHTLDKGMGGSEEAIVYLTRELAKQGWEVTVYGAINEALTEKCTVGSGSFPDNWHRPTVGLEPASKTIPRVYWKPWREINKSDHFNVFVAWRAPDFAERITANVKVADIHDILSKDTIKPYPDVTYFVKSKFHRDLYPDVPDDKFRIIGNGIAKEQFKDV